MQASRPGNANLIESLRNRVGSDAIAAVLDAGFNFDFFDDDVLRTNRQDRKRRSGDWAPIDIALLCFRMWNASRSTTYRMLAEFVRSGGVLIASRRQPAIAPGFAATEPENAEIRQISQELFSSSSNRVAFYRR